jgi:hypothetical protein
MIILMPLQPIPAPMLSDSMMVVVGVPISRRHDDDDDDDDDDHGRPARRTQRAVAEFDCICTSYYDCICDS